ncbi:MAG: hypothetical protein EOP53_02330 [Sphingobacteriales bacterium]|nr:MAG: hypothetical protein EOP53_02330 [Sphingobacteriales bacterium]
MVKFKQTINWLLEGAFIVLLYFLALYIFKGCGKNSDQTSVGFPDTVHIVTDTLKLPGDPYAVKVHDTVPGPVKIEKIPVPADADTAAIIAEFLTRYTYDSSFTKDNSFLIRYRLTISKNKLDSFKIWVQNVRETAIVTNKFEVNKPKRKFYAGITAGGNSNYFGMGPGILYQDKTEKVFGYEYDAFNRCHWLRAYVPLKSK